MLNKISHVVKSDQQKFSLTFFFAFTGLFIFAGKIFASTQSLNGSWKCASATAPNKDVIPTTWASNIPVPGLADW